MNIFFLSAGTLWQREIVRFLRQRSRIIGTFGQPILFWLLLGSGFGESFRVPGMQEGVFYLEFFYPGILAMVILFTAIFSTIVIIEDRKEHFLQAVLVAPVPRSAIVFGQALGSTSLALLQGILLLAAAPMAGIPLTLTGAVAAIVVMFLLAFALTSLGLLLAWRLDSTQGFHAILNMVLIPLWLLSGSAFPASASHPVLAGLMAINPVTYGVAALRRCLYLARPEAVAGLPELGVSLLITVLFGLVTFLAAVRFAEKSGV